MLPPQDFSTHTHTHAHNGNNKSPAMPIVRNIYHHIPAQGEKSEMRKKSNTPSSSTCDNYETIKTRSKDKSPLESHFNQFDDKI